MAQSNCTHSHMTERPFIIGFFNFQCLIQLQSFRIPTLIGAHHDLGVVRGAIFKQSKQTQVIIWTKRQSLYRRLIPRLQLQVVNMTEVEGHSERTRVTTWTKQRSKNPPKSRRRVRRVSRCTRALSE